MTMTSHRPYMIRALNEWILENNCTPYILVNAYDRDVRVPQSYVKDGQIILNISPDAVQGLSISNEGVEFNGRFGGIPTEVYVPASAILGIYAKENGQGMMFETDDPTPELPPKRPGKSPDKSKRSRPNLKVVK